MIDGATPTNVLVYVPLVAFGNPVNGITTGAFAPGSVQQCMCAAAAGPPIKPENERLTKTELATSSTTTRALPIAVEAFGGTSWLPVIVTLKEIVVALAIDASIKTERREAASRFMC